MFNRTRDGRAICLHQSSEASMSTLTPEELTCPVTRPAIDAAGLTTTCGESVRGSSFVVARERDDVLRYIGLAGAPKASAGAERCDALMAAGVRPAGVWL
jgi:hypothetical protein